MNLNLINKDRSDIDYEIINFPDSQQLITIKDWNLKYDNTVIITSRMSWTDIQLIICAVKALRNMSIEDISLYVPYFLGARSDRSFNKNSINYLKQVICPIINSLKLSRVIVLDPHSNCLEMGLNNYEKISNEELVESALRDYVNSTLKNRDNLIWLIPDKGATEKAYSTIKEINFKGKILECNKKRDIHTGNIISTEIIGSPFFEGEDCIIVDDICDGGKTFIELAKVAKKLGAGNLYLCVTHFVGGGDIQNTINNLSKYFINIYTTNSVISEFNNAYLKFLNIF